MSEYLINSKKKKIFYSIINSGKTFKLFGSENEQFLVDSFNQYDDNIEVEILSIRLRKLINLWS